MIHILLGILRYFNISCLWCLTKSLPEESCDFQFPKKKRDLSGLDFDNPKTIILFETFLGLNIFRLIQCKNKFFNYISCSFNFLCCSLIVFRFKFMLHECHISLMLQFSFCFARDLYFLAILIPNLCCCTTVFPLVLI